MKMSSTKVFYAISDFLTWTFGFYENVGNIFNYSLIVLGFVGLFYWLNWQKKFNENAKNDPNHLK
jgi:predicted negative regulator of RcsB-dependent stress response